MECIREADFQAHEKELYPGSPGHLYTCDGSDSSLQTFRRPHFSARWQGSPHILHFPALTALWSLVLGAGEWLSTEDRGALSSQALADLCLPRGSCALWSSRGAHCDLWPSVFSFHRFPHLLWWGVMGTLQTLRGVELPCGARHLHAFRDRKVIFLIIKIIV